MTDQIALSLISSNIMRSIDQKGICRSFHEGNPFPEAEPIEMDGSKIKYSSWATTKWGIANTRGNFVTGTGQVDVYRNMGKFIFTIDVTKLKEIRILDENKGGFDCSDSPDTALVIIKKKIYEQVAIEVQSEKVEKFVAALARMSPGAKIIKGLGF